MPKQRGGNSKSVMPAIRIYCEGEKTEPYYIKAYVNHFHSEQKRVIVVADTKKNTPVQLVEEAIAAKKSTANNDIFWVVYDRESQSKYPDSLHLEAQQKAKDNNIQVAFSNVCFEYWFLLHFGYTTASYDNCDELLQKSKLKENLKKVGIADYDKGLPFIFDKLKDKVPDAIANSAKLKASVLQSADPKKCAPCQLNPYIDVHELFIDMKNFISGSKSIRES
ncbi:RloB family protein [Aeromonas sp. sia0103]|uniref:RloB family protein n=1 Tax=Aeromonas sp. sia0103 TaxID=2854782 RepID=UPI001C45C8EB|nr:RloB family protein [Aeromonas sp. sia0103]MBV7599408.1 RloB family protein [Aeromonas sp. sia0103]